MAEPHQELTVAPRPRLRVLAHFVCDEQVPSEREIRATRMMSIKILKSAKIGQGNQASIVRLGRIVFKPFCMFRKALL